MTLMHRLVIAGLTAVLVAKAAGAAEVGTAFSYQGQLKDGTAPVSGACDLRFSLWDAASLGTQAGTTLDALGTAVTQGLFSVQLDFGSSAFDGNARWLGVEVRCPAGTGSYTPFTTRQALTATPYASHALEAPWTGLGGIPAGFADGIDNDTTYSAGGGLALTGGQFSVSFGGTGAATTAAHSDHTHNTSYWRTNGNTHSNPGVNFIGTSDNVGLVFKVNAVQALRLDPQSTSPNIIGGHGGNSVATGVYGATIGGGGFATNPNQVTGNFGVVGGGFNNQATNANATVGGGANAVASGGFSAVGGGYNGVASGGFSTVSGGSANTASGGYSAIGGGSSNTASGLHSSISGGFGAVASKYGESAQASGYFGSSPGTAQTSTYVLRNSTTGADLTYLYLDGASQQIIVPVGHSIIVEAQIVGRNESGTVRASYIVHGHADSTIYGMGVDGDDAYVSESNLSLGAGLLPDDATGAVAVWCTGLAGETMRWVATVRTTEVGW